MPFQSLLLRLSVTRWRGRKARPWLIASLTTLFATELSCGVLGPNGRCESVSSGRTSQSVWGCESDAEGACGLALSVLAWLDNRRTDRGWVVTEYLLENASGWAAPTGIFRQYGWESAGDVRDWCSRLGLDISGDLADAVWREDSSGTTSFRAEGALLSSPERASLVLERDVAVRLVTPLRIRVLEAYGAKERGPFLVGVRLVQSWGVTDFVLLVGDCDGRPVVLDGVRTPGEGGRTRG